MSNSDDVHVPATPKPSAAPASPAAQAASKSAARAAAARGDAKPQPNKPRRRFIWTSIGAFLAANFLMFLRFFFPRTLFEPSTVFKIGYPSDFHLGVDTRYKQLARIWVVREADRIFAIYARCTHLGCTPDWKESESKFKCPCHGSGYTPEGINFEGPAPRPMDRAHIEVDPQGQIVVDTSRLYEWPKGGTNHFDDPGAFIPV